MSDKLEIMARNLKELEKRAAMYGPGESPLFLLSQIEELREQIRQTSGTAPQKLARDTPPPEEIASFVTQLFRAGDGSPQVQVQGSWSGETGPWPLELPYSARELALVLKALATPLGQLAADRFEPDQRERLELLGLAASGYLLQKMYAAVGRALYGALFSGPAEKLFHAARSRAREAGQALALRLVFDPAAADLVGYPWELLHDDVPLVADGVVDLTRYVAFPGPRSRLEARLPLRVLGIAARPDKLPTLPQHTEPQAVAEGLRPLAEQEALEITWLSPPTRPALIDHLGQAEAEVHVVHFDGHGGFGRLCPICHILHTATSQRCIDCKYPLSTEEAQGYLAFEGADGAVNYVSARAFANALSRNRPPLVVLSACQSGQVGGAGVFSGVGPALIQAGVPAVVAMQLTVPVEQAVRFARSLYGALAAFCPLVEAVGRGRQQLYDETLNPRAWFVPTLYLRSDDPRGELFQPAGTRV